jgi:hypothetical protein
MVRVRFLNNIIGATLASVDVNSYNCDAYFDVSLATCNGCAVVARRIDNNSADFYTPTAIQTSASVSGYAGLYGWPSVCVSVGGGPASSAGVVDIEVFVNYEMTFDDGSQFSQITTPSEDENPALTRAASVVSTRMGQFFEKGLEQASAMVRKEASKLAMEGLATVFG